MTFVKKLRLRRIWERIFLERLTEPLHLNVLALGVALAGSFRSKVLFDLVLRPHTAYGLLKAADLAIKYRIPEISALEFGVAAGAGLLNMAHLARKVENATGIRIHVAGFDTGVGMPPPKDFRDHPDVYGAGDFPMDAAKLQSVLPSNARLVVGDIEQTVPRWLDENGHCPIGFVIIDTDYYCSSVSALKVLSGPAAACLPIVVTYVDDVDFDEHNSGCGELLAVKEFNEAYRFRKLEQPRFLRTTRVFKNAKWLEHIYFGHILDHPRRSQAPEKRNITVLQNPYL